MPFLLRHRFKTLLATLVMAIVVAPVLGDGAFVSRDASQGIVTGLSVFLLIAASLAAGGRRGALVWVFVLVVPTAFLEVASHFFWPSQLLIANHLVRIAFLGFVAWQVLRQLFVPELVTFDTLCASLSVYLIFGLIWMNAYVIHETLRPGSYFTTVAPADGADAPDDTYQSLRLLYFSFTTLTSVGFGDIVARTNGARMLAVMETLTGQSYLLIMVSRLVGLHVSQSMPGATTPPGPDEPGDRVN